MARRPAFFLILFLAVMNIGCANTIRVTGTLDHVQQAPPSRATFFVVPHGGKGTPAIRKEIRSRIEEHLRASGREVVSEAVADYALFFSFGTEERKRPDRPHSSLGTFGSVSAPPGWAHYLRIKVFDADGSHAVLWQAEVGLREQVTKNPAQPLDLLDLFVVAAFEYFLEETPIPVTVPVLEAKRIRREALSDADQ
jgi:hypothetical protein